MITAAEALSIAIEYNYMKKIRKDAERGYMSNILEFASEEQAKEAREKLLAAGFVCGKVKPRWGRDGTDHLFECSWGK